MDADNEIKVEMIFNKEHAYFNINGICSDTDIDEDEYESFKEAFTPMIEELQKYVIMANIEKELAEQ